MFPEVGIVDVSFKYFPFELFSPETKLDLPRCEFSDKTITINRVHEVTQQTMNYKCQRIGSYIYERLFFLEKYKNEPNQNFYIDKSLRILEHIKDKMHEKQKTKYTELKEYIDNARSVSISTI
jgi:hypothetical protein